MNSLSASGVLRLGEVQAVQIKHVPPITSKSFRIQEFELSGITSLVVHSWMVLRGETPAGNEDQPARPEGSS
jgi:hypothetical protein